MAKKKEPEAAPTTPEPPAPEPLTMEQIQAAIDTRLDSKLDTFTQGLQGTVAAAIQGSQPKEAPKPTTTISTPTEEEWAEAYDNGDPKVIAKLQRRQEAAQQAAFDARLEALAQAGEQRFSELALATAPAGLKHYERYKAEIMGMLKQTNAPVSHANIVAAYKFVVGEHSDELLAEERERALRGEPAETGVPSQHNSPLTEPKPDPNAVPDPAAVLSPGTFSALRLKFPDIEDEADLADAYAKWAGYKDWQDMYTSKHTAAYRRRHPEEQQSAA